MIQLYEIQKHMKLVVYYALSQGSSLVVTGNTKMFLWVLIMFLKFL